jgi:hypothetical protein
MKLPNTGLNQAVYIVLRLNKVIAVNQDHMD